MESSKKIIVSKLSKQRKNYRPRKDDVLVLVQNGKVADVVRNGREIAPLSEEGIERYCVDCRAYSYDLCYSGGISFTFSLVAEAAFPTIMIGIKDILNRDMTAVVQSWAASAFISDLITDFLSRHKITTEKQLFEGGLCKDLENTVKTAYQAHFIKSWGMFLNEVVITRQCSVAKENKDTFDPFYYIL